MSFLDTLKNLGLWQGQGQPQQPQPNLYGLDQPAMRQAGLAALGNIGGQIMALSQQMTPDQRARMMAGADWTGGLQTNLYNAAQMKLMGDAQRRKQMESERDQQAQAYALQQLQAMPDSPQKRKALIYAQLGDYAKAIETAMPQAGQPNYQLVDGKVVDMNNPFGGARQVPGLEPEGTKPDFQIVDGYIIDRNNPAAGAVPVPGLPETNLTEDRNSAEKLRSDFDTSTKGYQTVIAAAERGEQIATDPQMSPANKLAVLYDYIKTLDPLGSVRDSDVALAQSIEPVMKRLEQAYRSWTEGGGISDAAIFDIARTMGKLGTDARTRMERKKLETRDLATARRLNPEMVFGPAREGKGYYPQPPIGYRIPSTPGRRDLPQIPEPPLVRVEE